MATVTSATNYFPKAQEGFTTTLNGTIAPGATSLVLNSTAGYSVGDVVVLVIDPALSTKQVFTGVVATGNAINSVVWTEGTNAGHTTGATVVDYTTATHWDLFQAGILKFATQAGALSPTAVRTALGQTSATGAGWTTLSALPSTVTANGNRSYSMVFNTTDLTGTLSPGMRLMTQRTVAAPTQCTSLNGTTQFYSKTAPAGMTFTNNFVVSAWVKLSSYNGTTQTIASRYNGTSGWYMWVDLSGLVKLSGFNAGSGNFKTIASYQSIPLNKWVHVTTKLDMSSSTTTGGTNNYIMIDGVDVPSTQISGGTAPTALIQAGNLEIGSQNGGLLPFGGKIAQVAIYSAHVSEATILASMHQGLAGTETSLISAYSLNNSINDLNTTNANNLTANGSAVATNPDSPFGGQANGTISSTLDYAIVTAATFSTNTTLTVQVPEGCTIPTSGGVSAVSYATVKAPYGMPVQRGKWQVVQQNKTTNPTTATLTTGNYVQVNSNQISVPIGSWRLGFRGFVQFSAGSSSSVQGGVQLAATTPPVNTNNNLTAQVYIQTAQFMGGEVSAEDMLDIAAQTTYSLYAAFYQGNAAVTAQMRGDFQDTVLYAELAYL